MSRSKWKGPYIGADNLQTKDLKTQIILPRNIEITPKLVGQTLKVHNGKEYQELIILEEMVGHKLGEFVFTRVKFAFKKKKTKK